MSSRRLRLSGVSMLFVLAASVLLVRPAAAQSYLPAIPGSLDDTERIEQALDACNSPATECTVRLGPGIFRVGLIVVENFHGLFVGSGIGRTIVKAMPQIEAHFNLFEPVSKTNRIPNLFTFLSGNFTIADMSIRVEEYRPVLPYQWLPGLPDTYFMNTILAITQKPGGTAPKARVERVELSGADGDAGPFYGYDLPPGLGVNTNAPLFFGALLLNPVMTGGSLVTRDSAIKRGVTGFFTLRTVGSSVTVADNRMTEVVDGAGASLASGSHIRFERNSIQSWEYGVKLLQTPYFDFEGWGPPEPSRFVVSHNAIRESQIIDIPVAGIVAIDVYATIPGEQPRVDLTIANNAVTTAGPTWASTRYGVWLQTVVGAKVVNNDLLGSGEVALAMDRSTGCRLLSNSMRAFEAAYAQLWFSPGSSNCTAVGVSPSVTVVDEGENNVVRRGGK